MLSFFEYFFYRVYDLYTRHGEKDVPVFYGIAVLTLFQTLNIITLFLLYIVITANLSLTSINFGIWVLGIVFIINYAYFMRNDRHRKIIKDYSQEDKSQRKRKGFWVLGYAVSVFVLLIYTASLVREMVMSSM